MNVTPNVSIGMPLTTLMTFMNDIDDQFSFGAKYDSMSKACMNSFAKKLHFLTFVDLIITQNTLFKANKLMKGILHWAKLIMVVKHPFEVNSTCEWTLKAALEARGATPF